jgi:DNA polymerase-4
MTFLPRIACLDLDAFFVEVALKEHPELRGQPLIVGGAAGGRGVVCSASYEARRFGIRSGMPVWQAQNRCPQLAVLPVPATIETFSHAVRDRLREFCPVVDTASIDEFFLDFTGCDRLYPINLAIAERISQSLAHDPALPATIGIGTSRLMAKIASDLAKPYGILEILPGAERVFLAPLELKRLPGVGPRTDERLHALGLSRIGEIPTLTLEVWRHMLGKCGEALFFHAQGIDRAPVLADTQKEHQKQISRERTLTESTENPRTLLAQLSRLTESAAYELRTLQLTCGGISVRIKYDDFSLVSRSRTIKRTNRDLDLFAAAGILFNRLFTRRVKIRLVGITLEHLQSGVTECDLWDLLLPESHRRFPETIDRVRRRFGFQALVRARSLVPGRRPSVVAAHKTSNISTISTPARASGSASMRAQSSQAVTTTSGVTRNR